MKVESVCIFVECENTKKVNVAMRCVENSIILYYVDDLQKHNIIQNAVALIATAS